MGGSAAGYIRETMRTLALTVTALALSCGIALAQQTTGSLTGTVRAMHSRHALHGVAVTVTAPSLRRTVRTDANGRFSLNGLPGGLVGIVLSRGGFTPVRMHACVHPQETFSLDLVMNRSGGSNAAQAHDRAVAKRARLLETHDQYFIAC